MVRDLALTGNEYAYLVISETLIQDKRWDEDSGRVTSSPGGGKWEEARVRNPDTRWDDAIGSNTCFSLVNTRFSVVKIHDTGLLLKEGEWEYCYDEKEAEMMLWRAPGRGQPEKDRVGRRQRGTRRRTG